MPRSAVPLARLVAQTPIPDTHLLRAFVSARGEDAFGELVRRHGPMVLAVCRRVLSDPHDADDAFQATFLVLARKAGTIRGQSVAGWLYGVAVRTARGVRLMRDRRRKREQVSADAARGASGSEVTVDSDTAAILDEELAKLPDLYRQAIVLCELRGLSRREAAAELGIPEGTLSSRLAGAKRKLAERLSARGVVPSVALAALTPVTVSAALVQTTTAAIRGAAGGVANAAASAVVKAMLFEQLKATALAGLVCLAVVCGGLAMTGSATAPPSSSDKAPAPALRAVEDPAAQLVQQLGSEDFAARESAQKALRALGPKAEPALKSGLSSDNLEVRTRCAVALAEIRKDALAALTKGFDPKADVQPDHPIWKRYKAIAGDNPASRELFARVIANEKWLRTLDRAEADPAAAGHVYRVGFAEVFRDFDKDPAKSPPWPCYRGEEVAYLLLLGSHPDPTPPAKLTGDEVFPTSLRNTNFLGRGITHSEAQITHGRGLPLGLTGQWLDTSKGDNPPAIDGPPETDRVFAKLFAAWLVQRPVSSDMVAPAFRLVSRHHIDDLLPLARRYAANDFEPRREIPPLATAAALEAVAQLGTRADLPLFERYFTDKTDLTPERATREYRPLPPPNTTQLRDLALGLALLLHGRDPEEFGFTVYKDAFQKKGDRYEIAWYSHASLGFASDGARDAAFKKARVFFDEQAKKKEKEAQFWPQFAKLVGDDKDSRALFDLIVSNPKNLELLEQGSASARDQAKLYFVRRDDLYQAGHQDVPGKPGVVKYSPVPLSDVAGWLFFGTYPGTKADATNDVTLTFLQPNAARQAAPFADALAGGGPAAVPLRKLTGAWLANRGDDLTAYSDGLPLALRYDIPGTLPVARRLLKDYAESKGRGAQPFTKSHIRALSLLLIAKYGSAADRPLITPFLKDENLASASGEPRFTAQVRDAAAVAAVVLLKGDAREFGFYKPAKRAGGTTDGLDLAQIGFDAPESRATAHKKVVEWLDKQEKDAAPKPPEKGARLWPRFAKLVGDDKDSRALFDLIASEPKNLELLAGLEGLLKNADAPDADPNALFAPEKLYLARRDELNKAANAKEPVSLAAVYGWMYLGTFPRTDHSPKESRGLNFMPQDSRKPEQTELVRHLTGPSGSAGKRLLGAWAERQTANGSCRVALDLAFRYEIKEALAAARKTLAESLRLRPEEVNGSQVGSALRLVGKYGSETDVPVVAKFLTSTKEFVGHRPGKATDKFVEGEHISNQVRDTAAVVVIVLHKGTPEDFGFIWTKTEAAKRVPWADQLGTDPLDVQVIGFSTDADRTTAHKKLREWLYQQKK